MNSKYMVIVAAMAVMLIGATAFATDNAFADGKKKNGKNQATSQANACGNGKLPIQCLLSKHWLTSSGRK